MRFLISLRERFYVSFEAVNYFHREEAGAAEHMAWDEYFLEEAHSTGEGYFRVLDFESPAMVMARRTSPEDVQAAMQNGYDVTRRKTTGSTIPCLDNGLAYSVIVPTSSKPDRFYSEEIGPRLNDCLSEFLEDDNLSIDEKHHAIRYGEANTPEDVPSGRTVAGNSLWGKNNAVLCHGVIALNPWDYEKVSDGLDLREGEVDVLSDLPAVSDTYSDTRESLLDELIPQFAGYDYSELSPDRENIEDLLEQKYDNEEWIKSVSGEEKAKGHCFIEQGAKNFY